MSRVDPDEFLRQLEAKGVEPRCPACSQTAWTVPESVMGTNVVALSAMFNGNVVPDRAVPVVPVICHNCGLVRLHALSDQVESEYGMDDASTDG